MDGRLRLLMVASLVVNLFLAGALVGVLIVGARLVHDREGGRRGDGRPNARIAFQSIPEDRRRELARLMREPVFEAAPDFRASRDARRRAAELIAAPNYDAKAVQAAFGAAREREMQGRAKIDAALASRLAQLTQSERAAFGQVMLRGPRGFDRGHEERPRDGDRQGPSSAPPNAAPGKAR